MLRSLWFFWCALLLATSSCGGDVHRNGDDEGTKSGGGQKNGDQSFDAGVAGQGGEAEGSAAAGCETEEHFVFYVSSAGEDQNGGTGWENALRTLTRGLELAQSVADPVRCMTAELWVARGTYYPTTDGDRTQSFRLLFGVPVYGGFAGHETDRDQRDPDTAVTTLSGDIGVSGDVSDNSYHVVVGATDAVLDGFTITAGNARGSSEDSDQCGGGMLNPGTSPSITRCRFIDNTAEFGGGMCNQAGSPRLRDVSFLDNLADEEGGGMFNDQASPTLEDTTFEGNSVANWYGGGMYNLGARPELIGCHFEGNHSSEEGGAMFNTASSPSITDSTFLSNLAAAGAAIANMADSQPSITGCNFNENQAEDGLGGAIWNQHSNPSIMGSLFQANRAVRGGAIYDAASSSTVVASIFEENEVSRFGGAFYGKASSAHFESCLFVGNTAASGAGLYNEDSQPVVTSCTFASNVAEAGGGALFNQASSPTIVNSILWGDLGQSSRSEIMSTADSAATVSHCLIDGGYPDGTQILNEEPFFVNAASGDYHLRSPSPAVDAGDGCLHGSLRDLEHNPRWDIERRPNAADGLDLGAFEFQGGPSTAVRLDAFACD